MSCNQVTEVAGYRAARQLRVLRRAISGGYLLERRGPDRRAYVAVAREGWRLIEDSESSAA